MRLKIFLFRLFVNNFISNFFIRRLGLESSIYKNLNPYLRFKVNTNKSTQENAGYSFRPEINEVLEKSKNDLLKAIAENCKPGSLILDIGCGPGMYLSLLKNKGFQLFATDINAEMIEQAKKLIPEATYITGDSMNVKLDKKFDFIYCIGMLIYIPSFQILDFLKKLHNHLSENGIIYINYPHATNILDAWYNDLTYIKYSPQVLEKLISPYFEILIHEQAFDGRKIKKYDDKPYSSLNPDTDRTYKNSYLLIARKK